MIRAALFLAAVLTSCGREPQESAAPPRIPLSPAPQPLKAGQAIPDATLINQDGKAVRLSDYRGNPLVLTFIFTRCKVASMCPAVTAKLKAVQESLRKQGRYARVVVVSFDPGDRPDVLRAYALRHEIDLSRWDFATAAPKVVGPLARAFSVYYRRTEEEGFEHNIVVAIVDGNGIFRDDFFGAEWNTEEFVGAVVAVNP
ncbi:MAG: SCO family protein [Planctomycetes bacterium]|nr:SCO family protein [Planctomycetota bacterium]